MSLCGTDSNICGADWLLSGTDGWSRAPHRGVAGMLARLRGTTDRFSGTILALFGTEKRIFDQRSALLADVRRASPRVRIVTCYQSASRNSNR
ncbi:MAG TPA: hypothetical protein VJO33_19210 [Gemmatimonadaceae bacterium]|nr:hypothetical protein [Gemmatimonadaceae bacterium]